MPDNNPLLSIAFSVPFDQVRAEHVEPGVRTVAGRCQSAYRGNRGGSASPRTYANTMLALEKSTENLDYALSVVRHLEAVATSPELRAAWNAVEPETSAFYSRIPLNEGLWNQLKAFAATDEAKSLSGARLRFLTKTLDSFRRCGAELDAGGKDAAGGNRRRTFEMDHEILRKCSGFHKCLGVEYYRRGAVSPGLPPSAMAAARQSAESKGQQGWRFTLQAPSFTPAITYLHDDGDPRAAVSRQYCARARKPERDNRPIIVRILELRREKSTTAGLLRFRRFRGA